MNQSVEARKSPVKITLAVLAAGANRGRETVRNWIVPRSKTEGPVLKAIGARYGSEDRQWKYFEPADVVEVAIVAALVDLSVHPQTAGMAAAKWCRSGNAKRLPGHLFPEGRTVLVLTHGKQGEVKAHVINWDEELSVDEAGGPLRLGAQKAFIYLDVNRIYDEVQARLEQLAAQSE